MAKDKKESLVIQSKRTEVGFCAILFGEEAEIELSSIECTLTMEDIYDKAGFNE